MNHTVIKIKNLHVNYRTQKKSFPAVKNFSMTINTGETVGLVGESGCGKSTVGKALLGLTPYSSGTIERTGNCQMIFQDPYSALNPRMTIEEILIEPLMIQKKYHKSELQEKAENLITSVQLPPSYLKKKPNELSGGQQQRINIARAIALDPSFIFCDEPVSSLDSIHQKEVIQLLQTLQREKKISYLFVSHNLPLVCSLSDRVAVMYCGEIIEYAPSTTLSKKQLHPYTKALFSAVPIPDPKVERRRKKIILKNELPTQAATSPGCPFYHRCPNAKPLCLKKAPPLVNISEKHTVRCHFID